MALVGAAAAAASDSDALVAWRLLANATRLNARFPSCYGAAWTALGRIMLATNWLPGGCPPLAGR